jgi:hydroxymethylpyrimidine pyrophosphatase-like HAD family hydrolase
VPRYRLLAIDLDGTLLSSRREIPEENRSAVRDAARQGVAIAIVTGRRFPALKPYVESLGVDAYVVANSGAIIREGLAGPILQRCLLPVATALAVLELSSGARMEPILHDGPDAEGHIILRDSARGSPSLGHYLSSSFPPPRFVPSIALERAPVQIGFTGGVEEIRALERQLHAGLDDRGLLASLVRTEYPEEDLALLDVLSPEATKSSAVDFLCARLGIAIASTMAIGDNWNDLGMLERAGLGVLMDNATDELKRRSFAFASTLGNDDAGVAFAIRRYLLDEDERFELERGVPGAAGDDDPGNKKRG